MSNPNDYTVGWICAISTELVAARTFLDEEHDSPNAVSPCDNNIYTLGKMGKHNVVIAALPDGEYGTSAAASVARDMLHSFPNVRIGLMVGIGGGVPSRHDIRLGDVVVSATQNEYGGVFQYDFGKTIQAQEFQNTKFLNQPPVLLRSAVGGLKADYESNGHQFQETINSILTRKPRLLKKYQRPDSKTDRLYLSNAVHPLTNESCSKACSDSMLVPREQRAEDEDDPIIHYGLIASGNQLMKDALIRDQLASEKDIICFEMDAAGLMNHFPCLVIRGICDYSDSHKNKAWQGYAAMTAAAYAKDLIRRIPPTKIEAENRIADVLSGVKHSVDRLVSVYHDQRNINILDWLAPLSYSTQQRDFLRRRQQGTGEWLLSSDQFQTWVKKENHMLFCPGMPGAGKTILTSVVVDHLQSRFQEDPKVGIAYFFFDYKQQDEQTIDTLLASFLRQLIASQSVFPEVVHELYKKHNTQAKRTRPSTEELIEVLKSAAAIYSRVFITIDALDECKMSNGTRLRVLSLIFKLRSETKANLLITSRFNAEISGAFSSIPTLEIRASDEDVQKYLRGNMIYLTKFVRNDPILEKEIIGSILQAVQGMFLVAQFHFDSLRGKTTPNQITTALQSLATGSDAYEQIYTKTMERIGSQYHEHTKLANSVLSWLTFAKRPMRVAELQHALGVKPQESCFDKGNMPGIELIVSVCTGLVTLDNDSNIIRLVHYTTQEYFQQTHKNWFPDSRSEITMSCIAYLAYEVFDLKANDDRNVIITRMKSSPIYNWKKSLALGDAIMEVYPFYKYASLYWGEHAREDPVLSDAVMRLLKNTAWIETYCNALLRISQWRGEQFSLSRLSKQTTGLHLATWFGFTAAVDELLNNNTHIETTNISGDTALHTSAHRGHESVTLLLLDNSANAEAVESRGRTPLHLAALNNSKAVVQLLLDKSADINAADTHGYTPLHLAVGLEHKEITTILLSNGAKVDAIDNNGKTPLLMTIDNDFVGEFHVKYEHVEPFIQLLLDKGADIKAADNGGSTSLHLAVKWYNEEAAAGLLSKGAEVNATDKHGYTPLTKAITQEDPLLAAPVVQLLLNNGADVKAADNHGSTPLHLAVECGLKEVVARLLDKGAQVNATDNNGKTPLFIPVDGNFPEVWDVVESIFQLLLNNGAEVNGVDNNGKTPLFYAIEKKCDHSQNLVQLLLNNGANIHATDENGNTVLHQAVRSSNGQVIELLLRKGADINAANNNGKTPLFYALEREHSLAVFFVQLLLNNGANIQATDENGNTVLHHAVRSNSDEIIELLLRKGAKVNAVNNNSRTPLFDLIEYQGFFLGRLIEPFIQVLLNYGADVQTIDYRGDTVLDMVLERKNRFVAQLLRRNGAIGASDVRTEDLENCVGRRRVGLHSLGEDGALAEMTSPLADLGFVDNRDSEWDFGFNEPEDFGFNEDFGNWCKF